MKRIFILNLKISALTFTIILSFFNFSPAMAEEVNIAIASVPIHSQMENITRQGLVYDLVKEISVAGGLNPQFHFLPLKRTIHIFISDNVDFLIGFPGFLTQFGINPNDIIFVPMMITKMWLFCYKPYHRNGIEFRKLSDLNNYLVGVIRGSPLKPKLTKAGVKSYELDSHYAGFMMLKERRVDLIASVQHAGNTIVSKYFPKEAYNFVILKKPVECKKFGILAKKNDRAIRLKKLFEKGLKKIRRNGEYVKIFKKYRIKNIPSEAMLK